MKLIRLIFIGVILLLIFKTNLVSQFHVESKVELHEREQPKSTEVQSKI